MSWNASRTARSRSTSSARSVSALPAGSCWSEAGKPDRLPATYHRTHGVTYFHRCSSVGDDTLWGVNRRRKGATNTLAALRPIRAARPDGAPVYVILDNPATPTS